jgi:hypothetical protein
MAVGLPLKTTYANGDVYSASDVNDTNGTINAYVSTGKAAGVNKIINGAFNNWQRGTSFASAADSTYFADRFITNWSAGGATNTFSRQTFTPGTAPVSGYESQYFARCAATGATGTTQIGLGQRIEDVRTLAGQAVTFSFWAKADSARTLSYYIQQNFGSGGSTTVNASGTVGAITTSWARYSVTVTLGAMTGKTIGTGSYLQWDIFASSQSGSITFDFWGVQLEQGSTTTAFQTATGTIQGELAACQRYYWQTGLRASRTFGVAQFVNSVDGLAFVALPVTMRVNPSNSVSAATDFEVINAGGTSAIALTAISFGEQSVDGFTANLTTASGMTTGQASIWRSKSAGNATLKVSAEL